MSKPGLKFLLIVEVTALIAGTVYSLTRKYQNLIKAEGLPGEVYYFRHPIYQSLWCFAGHLLAWPLWWWAKANDLPLEKIIQKHTIDDDKLTPENGGDPPPLTEWQTGLLCLIPTLFDVVGTVLNNMGLILTHVSIYQMLRGSVVIFTGIVSRMVLKNLLPTRQRDGIIIITAGIILIATANTIFNLSIEPDDYAPWPAMGNFLIILSQWCMAGLFVAEEKVLKAYQIHPIQLLAWEGTWGTLLTAIIMFIAFLIPGRDSGRLENPVQATLQMMHSKPLLFALVLMPLVLLLFNLAGVYITKTWSAVHRATIDATRQALVWVHALAVGWEFFNWIELVGYLFLLVGTLYYNEAISSPCLRRCLQRIFPGRRGTWQPIAREEQTALKDNEATKNGYSSVEIR